MGSTRRRSLVLTVSLLLAFGMPHVSGAGGNAGEAASLEASDSAAGIPSGTVEVVAVPAGDSEAAPPIEQAGERAGVEGGTSGEEAGALPGEGEGGEEAAAPDPNRVYITGGGVHGAAAEPEEFEGRFGRLRKLALANAEGEEIPGLTLRLYWKDGPNYKVENELNLFGQAARLDGRFGMRLQVDAAGYETGGITDVHSGIDIRRLFFFTTGRVDTKYPILFELDLGLEDGRFYLDDAYLWFTELPWVNTLKIGQFTAPMGLAQLTGSGNRPFMETATPSEAFAPGSKAGLQIAGHAYEKRLLWQFGWFADSQAVPVGDASDSVSRLVGRVTGLPFYQEGAEGNRLLHIGFSASAVFADGERVRYRSRPESFLAPRVIDTDFIDADEAFLFGLEAAWEDGPLSLQSEMFGSAVNTTDASDPFFFGVYGEASYFLTGENRPFNLASSVFGSVTPSRPFSWREGTWGAWELAGRVSYTDLESAGVDGGRALTFMSGVNWYLSSYSRLLFEYGFSNVDGGPQNGDLHIFQMRFQIRT
jgi:phosphate-selective porin OprO/OprP